MQLSCRIHQYSKISYILYTNNKLSERELKKVIPLTRAIENNKILRNKFNQGGKRPDFFVWFCFGLVFVRFGEGGGWVFCFFGQATGLMGS